MLEVIGALAVTVALAYPALWAFTMAFCCFIGFDEFNIPAGIVLTLGGLVPCAIWWFVVGSRLHINFN